MNCSLVAVDIGNTAVKVGWFSPDSAAATPLPVPASAVEWPTDEAEARLASDRFPAATTPWFVTSVNRPALERLMAWRDRRRSDDPVRLLSYRDVPLRLAVDHPERVGMDRLATAVAADALRAAHRPALVVDAGTALKVHAVTADSTFLGGAILPGFQMASRALHANTDLLPDVRVTTNITPPQALGRNTEAAIRSGIYWGAVGAVRELIQRMREELGAEPQIFITGGDAGGLSALVDHDTQFVPHLCLAGVALMARRLPSHEA